MKRYALFVVLALVLASPASAQVIVHDPGNFVHTSLISARTAAMLIKVIETFNTLTAMSARLQDMDRFRTPPIVGATYNPDWFTYARPLLEALINGDRSDDLYRQSVRTLPPLDPILDALRLPPEARRAIETQYGRVQVFDAVIPRAVHQSALLRGFASLDRAIQALDDDVRSPRDAMHYMTAILGKLAAGSLLQNRQQTSLTQIGSHALEQLIARNTARRDDAATAMNYQLGALQDGPKSAEAQIAGADNALNRWVLR